MTQWEADVYAHHLDNDEWNERWWEYVSKTHFNDTAAYYYNYAVATVLKFQLNDYIARKILHQPPQSRNYAGNKEVGGWLLQHDEKGRHGRLEKSAKGRDRRKSLDPTRWSNIASRLWPGSRSKTKGARSGWDQDDKERQEHREKEERAERG